VSVASVSGRLRAERKTRKAEAEARKNPKPQHPPLTDAEPHEDGRSGSQVRQWRVEAVTRQQTDYVCICRECGEQFGSNYKAAKTCPPCFATLDGPYSEAEAESTEGDERC